MAHLGERTDQELLAFYAGERDECAFAELAGRHQAMILSTAARMCGSQGEAEDVLQQVLIVLARRAPELGQVKSLAAWLHRATTLEAKKAVSKRIKRTRRETMAYQTQHMAGEGKSLADEISPLLDESLNALSERDRTVLTMHYLEGTRFKTIAQVLGGTAASCQKQSVRALAKLTEKLRRKGVVVTVTALATVMSGMNTKAGVSGAVLEQMTQKAVGSQVGGAATSLLPVIVSMKTGIIVSIISGALLSFGWGVVTREKISVAPPKKESVSDASLGNYGGNRSRESQAVLTLEMVKQAIEEYDSLDKLDPQLESRLRSLMFSLPRDYLKDVLESVRGVEHPERFPQVLSSLFARWAEFDPIQALAESQSVDDHSKEARLGVMITWLAIDQQAALAELAKSKNKGDFSVIKQFINYHLERDPREAAIVLDALAEVWPEADRKLFEEVARRWAQKEPMDAADWVESYYDVNVRNAVLAEIARRVSWNKGSVGMDIASKVSDPAWRAKARAHAAYWWGIGIGKWSLDPERAKPGSDLSKGFPDDWVWADKKRFSGALMENFVDSYGDLIRIAKTDEDRHAIYQGIIEGAGHSKPSAIQKAVVGMDDSMTRNEGIANALKVYIRRWNELDADGARTWLDAQPAGEKASIMWEEIGREEE